MFKVNTTRLTTYTVICCFLFRTSLQSSRDSCHISRSTVQIVEDCPNSKKQWKQAAMRKNCAAYASQCSEPERLEYHCVINPFFNQTLEVCAYAQNIVLGFCTEYSLSGNMIQQSAHTACLTFTENSCPVFYRSTEAHKFPGCYDLTKKSALNTEDRESTMKVPTATAIHPAKSSKSDLSGNENKLSIILLVLTTACTLMIVGFHIFSICYRVRRQNRCTRYEEKRDPCMKLLEQGELSQKS